MANHYQKPEKGLGYNRDEYESLRKLGPYLRSQYVQIVSMFMLILYFCKRYGRLKEEEEDNLVIKSLRTQNEVQKQIRNVQRPEDKLLSEDIVSTDYLVFL